MTARDLSIACAEAAACVLCGASAFFWLVVLAP